MDGLPIPCARCGAPMAEAASTVLTGNVIVTCALCGHSEPLPRAQAERVQTLRARLLGLRAAQAAAEAPALAIARIAAYYRSFHALAVVAVVLLAWAGQAGPSSLVALRAARGRSLQEDALSVLGPALVPYLIVPGIVLGAVLGYFLMMAHFRGAVRPLLLARPPRHPYEGARCRSCGGGLPPAQGASIACTYCGAPNFFGPELTTRRAALLAAEADEHRARAQGFVTNLGSVGTPARRFYLGIAIGAVLVPLLGTALAIVIDVVIPR
jgi:hypothetical protein